MVIKISKLEPLNEKEKQNAISLVCKRLELPLDKGKSFFVCNEPRKLGFRGSELMIPKEIAEKFLSKNKNVKIKVQKCDNGCTFEITDAGLATLRQVTLDYYVIPLGFSRIKMEKGALVLDSSGKMHLISLD